MVKKRDNKVVLWIIGIVLFILLAMNFSFPSGVGTQSMANVGGLSGCAGPAVNKDEKEACENSGGEYVRGVGETGIFYYCKCLITKYETYSKTCSEITQDMINKCSELSNKFVDCSNSGVYNEYYGEGVCECIFKESNQKSFLVYKELLKCTCQCFEEDCVCMCPIYRK